MTCAVSSGGGVPSLGTDAVSSPSGAFCSVWMGGFISAAEHPEQGHVEQEYTGRTFLQSIEQKSGGICSLVNELSQDMVFGFGLKSTAKPPGMLFRGGFSARSVSGLWQFDGSTCGVSSACGILVAVVRLSLWMTLGVPWPLKPWQCSVHALSV